MSMDAVEFINERNRMCKASTACAGCALRDRATGLCPKWCFEHPEEAVAAVEKWTEEHPRKTRQSVFLEQYPETQIDNNGVLGVCPAPIFHSHRTDGGGCIDLDRKCPDCRREFWSQEVE